MKLVHTALAVLLWLTPASAAPARAARPAAPARADSVKAKGSAALAKRAVAGVKSPRSNPAAATGRPQPPRTTPPARSAGMATHARRATVAVASSAQNTVAKAPVRSSSTSHGFLHGLAVEPLATGSHDSEGNRTLGTGLLADVPVRPGFRVGIQSLRTRVEDDLVRGLVDDWRLRATMRPRRSWRIEASTGAARLAPPAGGTAFHWVGGLRTRWRATGGRPSGEFRLERAPLVASPLLLGNHAFRNEGRLALELPVRKLRLRGAIRGATIASAGVRNHRGQAEAAIALPLSPAVTPFIQYRSMGYLHPASTGYFAPHRVEMVESGSTFECGRGAPWLLSLEFGAGVQRMQAFGAPLGAWGPALRGYGYLSYLAGAGCELRLEAENENSPGLATSAHEDWRYRSLSFALRWALP